jgi:hypothetical protein
MATLIVTDDVRHSSSLNIPSTFRIRVRILLAGGSEKTLLYDHAVPSGYSMRGYITWTGTLNPA